MQDINHFAPTVCTSKPKYQNQPFKLAQKNYLNSYEKGIAAEFKVAQNLISNGYEILGKRIKTKYGEIDILAKKDNDIVACEVKQRKTFSIARNCITFAQKKRIANAFLHIVSTRNKSFENYRIDVLYLDCIGNIEHIQNAFFAEDYITY